MTFRRAALTLLSACLLTVAFAAPAGAQATRTWISGVGDDANPCSRPSPCKTMAGAISKTAEGGEINAIDPGGFGAVTITKAITIDFTTIGSGGVLNSGVTGVIVNAGSDDDVVLRGLDIYGAQEVVATPPCVATGVNGVRVLGARSVRIENTQIAQQSGAGIEVAPTASNPSVLVNRVDIGNICTRGIRVAPAAGFSANVMVRDSTIANAGTALSVGAGGRLWLTGSTVFGNALGFEALDGGVIESYDDNTVVGNTVDGTPTTTHTNVGPQGPAGPVGAPGPEGPAGEPAVKLMLALSTTSLKARAGRRVSLRYAATAAARAALEIRRGGKRVATVRSKARAGRNTIRWSGKVRRKPAAAGRYKLTLVLTGADGQTDRSTAALRVRR
jgi:hypothetical protein